ncbi:MAG TPA: hypothetical protein VK540_06385 [Polyangiaceae bacterium]|nr:hypothetical protein [Polyangiaceae bacterium]
MAEAKETTKARAAAMTFGALDIVTAILLYIGVFEGLPARYWLVDGGAVMLIALFAAAGVGLVAGTRWASRAALAASLASLVLGLSLITLLALTASYLSGIYGAVGRGGAMILGLIAALALPYLVAIPLAQLAWLGRRLSSAPPAPTAASGS